MSHMRATQELASNLAAMALNVVNDHIPIFQSTSWLNVQFRHMVGHLVEESSLIFEKERKSL